MAHIWGGGMCCCPHRVPSELHVIHTVDPLIWRVEFQELGLNQVSLKAFQLSLHWVQSPKTASAASWEGQASS